MMYCISSIKKLKPCCFENNSDTNVCLVILLRSIISLFRCCCCYRMQRKRCCVRYCRCPGRVIFWPICKGAHNETVKIRIAVFFILTAPVQKTCHESIYISLSVLLSLFIPPALYHFLHLLLPPSSLALHVPLASTVSMGRHWTLLSKYIWHFGLSRRGECYEDSIKNLQIRVSQSTTKDVSLSTYRPNYSCPVTPFTYYGLWKSFANTITFRYKSIFQLLNKGIVSVTVFIHFYPINFHVSLHSPGIAVQYTAVLWRRWISSKDDPGIIYWDYLAQQRPTLAIFVALLKRRR